ncbi:MAG TPA: hypothetical protein VLE74_01400 [Candidatus Saccharimonadales bacterium]|nr:hypothetical protein [Candidatus Saccharimonadales bacterium]
MFGKDDNQKQTQDSSDPLQAAMPEPIAGGVSNDLSASSPAMDAVANTPTLSAQPDFSAPELPPTGTPDPTPASDQPAVAADDDGGLMQLKQQALQHLSPLVSHLDQTPEEKFRTTMMMIQASDDQTLIKSAFEAAQQITDDKARAQALLDVINEINYFTQHQQSAPAA